MLPITIDPRPGSKEQIDSEVPPEITKSINKVVAHGIPLPDDSNLNPLQLYGQQIYIYTNLR